MNELQPAATVESVIVVGSTVTISTREAIQLPFRFLPEPEALIHARASAEDAREAAAACVRSATELIPQL